VLEPRIPQVSKEALDFSFGYWNDVPHQSQNLENMIKFFRDNQPVIANRLLGALEDFLADMQRQGVPAESIAQLRFLVVFSLVLSWHALYKQEQINRDIIEGDEGD
jgi:hypothetical protein